MNKLLALTSRIPQPKLLRVGYYHYGTHVRRNLAPLSQALMMATLALYLVSLFLAPTIASAGTIEHYSAVRVAEQTKTTSGWSAVAGTANAGTDTSANGWVDSGNLTPGEDYLVMVWGEHNTSSTSGRSAIRVTHGGSAFAESESYEETARTNVDLKKPYFWFTVWTAVANEDLEVEFYNETATTHTVRVEDVSLVVMNAEDLVANNELIYNISTTGGTLNTTFTPKATINWTPDNASDTWWLGGYVKHDTISVGGQQQEARFDINSGTIRGTYSSEVENAIDTPNHALGWVQQFAASSQTVELEVRESAADTEWDAAGIFALRLDGFETFKAYASAGDGTPLTTNNVYVEQGNVDHQMLSEGEYMIAAGAVVDDNGGNVMSKLQLDESDITDPVSIQPHNITDTVPFALADLQRGSRLGLKDIDLDAQRTSSFQAELQDRWVVAFSMERAGPPPELAMDGYIFENDDGSTSGFSLGTGGGIASIRGSSSAFDANGSSVTVTTPTETEEGDLLILFFNHGSGGVDTEGEWGQSGSDFTFLQTIGANSFEATSIWSRSASSGDAGGSGSATFNTSNADAVRWVMVAIQDHNGVDQVEGYNDADVTTNPSVSDSITPNEDDTLLLGFATKDHDAGGAVSWSSVQGMNTVANHNGEGTTLYTGLFAENLTDTTPVTRDFNLASVTDSAKLSLVTIKSNNGQSGASSFPNYLSTTETTSTNFGTGNVNYPAATDAGDLLLLTYTGSDTISSVGDSFTLIKQRVHSTSDYSTEVYALVADGTEDGGTVSVSLATSANLALFQMIRIEAGSWGGTISTDIDVSTAATGANDANPDSVTADWGSDKNLFVAVAGVQDDGDFASGPASYTNFVSSDDGINSSHATATRELAAASDDPGTFDAPGTDPWAAMTLVIKPFVSSGEISFSRVQSASNETFINEGIVDVTLGQTPESGNLLVATAIQRDVNSHADFSISGSGWTKQVGRDTQLGNTSAQRSFAVWTKVAGSSEPTNIEVDINVDTNDYTAGLLVQEFSAGTSVEWIFEDSADNDSGTGSTSPLTTGTTANVPNRDLLVIGAGVWRRESTNTLDTFGWTNGLGDQVTQISGTGHGTAINSAFVHDTIGGAKDSSLSWNGTGHEASAAILVLSASSTGGQTNGAVLDATQQAGSEFSSGQIPAGVRQGERLNLRMHLTNSGGRLKPTDELALFYDRGDGIWSKVKSQQPPMSAAGEGCDDSAWTCETITSTNDSGRYSSMAIDRLGHPWISYREDTNAELKVARYIGSEGSGCSLASWSCLTVDSGTDSGEHTSIAVGRESDVWVSYWDDASDDLRVANFVTIGGNCDDLYGGSDGWNCEIIDSTGSVGEYSSITLDRFGNPWVSYYDATNTRLKVAEYVGSGGSGCASAAWTCTIVENTGVEGQWSSIAFDNEGKPWVSYYHSSSTELKVARYVQGGGTGCSSAAWTCYVVDSDSTSGEYSSIGFSPDGTAYVSYWHQTANNLRVANFVGSGGNCDSGSFGGSDAWQCTEIDTANNVGSSTSLAFSPGGDPWISYRDSTNNTLRLARFVGSGGSGCALSSWTCTAIESVTGAANGRTTLAFDPNGLPWISHFNETADDLLIARLNTRAGEIISSRSQGYVNGASILASRADMSSVSDTSNRDSADCLATAIWNDGQYIEDENAQGFELPQGLGPDQCTEVMWTLDTSQATPGTTYRFMVATADNFRPDHGLWRGPVAMNEIPSLTMDSAEASVYRYSKDNLPQFANCNTDTAWGCQSIDTTDGGGQYTSTGFDPSGNPWVSYYETTNDDLKVARYVGTGGSGCADSAWHCTTIDSGGDIGQYTSLAFDHAGAAWISYYDVTNTALKATRYVGSGGSGCDSSEWSCAVVDSADDAGRYSSLAFDASGKPWISYYDVTNADLSVARYVGTAGVDCADIAWTCSTIESADDIGSHSSLAFDHTGKPWVSYYDATNANLKAAHYSGLGDSSTCAAAGGGSLDIEATHLTTDAVGTNGTSVNTASISPSANHLILAVVMNGIEDGEDPVAPTLSGNGLTWVQVAEATQGNDSRLTLFRAMGASPTSGQVIISTGGETQHAWAWSIAEFDNVDTTGTNGSGAIVQFDSDAQEDVTGLTVNLAAFEDSGNAAYGGFGTHGDSNPSVGSGFSLLGADNVTDSERDLSIMSEWKDTADPSVDATWSQDDGFAIAVEIRRASGGGGGGGGESNWDCETVDATDDVGQYSSIAFDASGDAWVSYYDATGGNLEVANFTGSGGDCDSVGAGSDDWECTTVDSTDNVGRFTSIAFDATGMAWVSYLDFTNTDLNAAKFVSSGGDCNSSAWDCMDISSSAAGNNAYSAIAFDLSGVPWISHESTSGNSLNMAHLHLPPTRPTADTLIPFATRSALSGDLRYRLDSGLSPYTDPYGTCGATSDRRGYCGLYHPEGHRDAISALTDERPMYSFSTRFSANTELPTALAVFMSNVSPATENLVLQVYRFGSTNAWETVTTYNSAGCTTSTCTIRAMPNGTPSDYFEADGSEYWVHFRLYQTESSGDLTLQLDHFTAEAPVKFLRGGRVFRETQTDPLGW